MKGASPGSSSLGEGPEDESSLGDCGIEKGYKKVHSQLGKGGGGQRRYSSSSSS